jgi:hypothetical protein
MLIRNAVAPSYTELRPLQTELGQSPTPGIFPVYGGLVEKLLHPTVPPETGWPDGTVAHTLATCAGYAYSDASTVAEIMARMGLEENHCCMVGEYNDPMFICSTAFLVQSSDGRVVILAYRGTEPVNLISWLTDADAHPDKVRLSLDGNGASFDVHAGFYRNVRATRYKVAQALQRALAGQSVREPDPGQEPEKMANPMEALYVTGHSLGGAMAAIMGILLVADDAYRTLIFPKLKAVYTYGQPMIGSEALAEACDDHPFLGKRVFRYVYEKDPVPHLPSTDTGRWANYGIQSEYDSAARSWGVTPPVAQMHFIGELLEAFASFPAWQIPLLQRMPFKYRIDDHRPEHYIATRGDV